MTIKRKEASNMTKRDRTAGITIRECEKHKSQCRQKDERHPDFDDQTKINVNVPLRRHSYDRVTMHCDICVACAPCSKDLPIKPHGSTWNYQAESGCQATGIYIATVNLLSGHRDML
jgi:hypothetical protein